MTLSQQPNNIRSGWLFEAFDPINPPDCHLNHARLMQPSDELSDAGYSCGHAAKHAIDALPYASGLVVSRISLRLQDPRLTALHINQPVLLAGPVDATSEVVRWAAWCMEQAIEALVKGEEVVDTFYHEAIQMAYCLAGSSVSDRRDLERDIIAKNNYAQHINRATTETMRAVIARQHTLSGVDAAVASASMALAIAKLTMGLYVITTFACNPTLHVHIARLLHNASIAAATTQTKMAIVLNPSAKDTEIDVYSIFRNNQNRILEANLLSLLNAAVLTH